MNYFSKNNIRVIAGILILISIFMLIMGWYPVTIVDGTPIFATRWIKAQNAAEHFSLAEKAVVNGTPNSSLTTDEKLYIKKITLAVLVEREIIRKKGATLEQDFPIIVEDKVSSALVEAGGDTEDAAKALYGLTMQEFIDLVLRPQAERDVVADVLSKKGVSFDEWFLERKREAEVRLYFTGFRWTGETVE